MIRSKRKWIFVRYCEFQYNEESMSESNKKSRIKE